MLERSRDPVIIRVFLFQAELISESLVVFVCSTTGQGDPPDNMKVPAHAPIQESPGTFSDVDPGFCLLPELLEVPLQEVSARRIPELLGLRGSGIGRLLVSKVSPSGNEFYPTGILNPNTLHFICCNPSVQWFL